MSRIDKYILAQLIGLFGFFSLVLVTIYWINTAAKLFDQVIADGQSAAIFFEFSALSLPNIIFLVAPASAMVAVVYCMNQLGSDRALNIFRATGMSGAQLSKAFIVYGIFVTLLLLTLAHYLVPVANQQNKIRKAALSDATTARMFTAGTFVHPVQGVTFYVKNITEEGELQNIFLDDDRGNANKSTYTALQAFLVDANDGPQLVMLDGRVQIRSKASGKISVTKFNDFVFDLTGFTGGASATKIRVRDLTTAEMLRAEKELSFRRIYEIAFRTAGPINAFVAIVLALAAMNAGGFSRFGMWSNILWAGTSFVTLKVAEAAALDFVDRTKIVEVMFAPAVIGILVTVILIALKDRPWEAGKMVPS